MNQTIIIGILLICLLLLIIKVYIKIKYPFWAIQPVYHIWNINYKLYNHSIINTTNFKYFKYLNFKNIKCFDFDKLSTHNLNIITYFIQNNYLNTKSIHYKPSSKNIIPYFNNSKYSTVCVYKSNNNIIGCMFSRAITIIFNNSNKINIIANYIDFLCIHQQYRKQGYAPQIIQTHEYLLREKNKQIIQICLFKKEIQSHLIVPLTTYNTLSFYISDILNNITLDYNQTIKTTLITANNLTLLYDYLNIINNKFKCYIIPPLTNLIELIKSKNYIIYITTYHNKLINIFIYKNSTVLYNKKLCIDLIASSFINNKFFIDSFYKTLNHIYKNTEYKIINIEEISMSKHITKHIYNNKNINIISKTPMMYYLYNYICNTILSSNCFIVI